MEQKQIINHQIWGSKEKWMIVKIVGILFITHFVEIEAAAKKTNKCLGKMKYSIGKFIVVSVFPKSQALCMCILRKSDWLYKDRKLCILLK